MIVKDPGKARRFALRASRSATPRSCDSRLAARAGAAVRPRQKHRNHIEAAAERPPPTRGAKRRVARGRTATEPTSVEGASLFLQQATIERMRQQVAHAVRARRGLEIRQNHLDIAGELPQN